MITLRRSRERHHAQRRKHEVWLTFDPQDRTDPLADGFGTLEARAQTEILILDLGDRA
jgi:hypothetical protein